MKINKNNNVYVSEKIAFFLGGLLGIILFILIYGVKVLNPSYIQWLLEGDIGKHYLGWLYYRNSDWYFPFGLVDGVNGVKISIIYFDSIPLFATIFKILSPLLPQTFQYFGIYGLVSFALMGGFSCLLLIKYYKNVFLALIGSIIFILSPNVLQRMFSHTALAGQWILIVALYLWLIKPYMNKKIVNMLLWGTLMILVCGIHIYFIPMVMLMLLSCSIEDFIRKESKCFILCRFLLTPILGILMIWAYGGFYGQSSYSDSGLGFYVSNLNSLINSMGFSSFFPSLACNDGNYEGFAYLGIGIIIALILIYIFFEVYGKKNKQCFGARDRRILIFITVIIFIFISMCPEIYYGQGLLCEIKFPQFVIDVLSIFRANGRFIWGACYILMLVAMLGIYNVAINTEARVGLVIGTLVLVQIMDLGGSILSIHNTARYTQYLETTSKLNEKAWEEILNNKEELFYVRDIDVNAMENSFNLNEEAATKGVATSQLIVSRWDMEAIQERVDKVREELLCGRLSEKIVYIFPQEGEDYKKYPLNYYEVDGYIVGLKNCNSKLERIKGVQHIYTTPYRVLDSNEVIWFSTSKWNASDFVYSGISESENEYTWTNENYIKFRPLRINDDLTNEKWTIALYISGTYNGEQRVRVYNEDEVVYDEVVAQNGVLNIPVKENINGEINLSIDLPNSISPLKVGESNDDRELALKLVKIEFRKAS